MLTFVNAAYFRGTWLRKFTKINDFFTTGMKTIETEFLTGTHKYYYLESAAMNAKILRIPYSNPQLSMFIILPKGHIDEFVLKFEADLVNRQIWYLNEELVKVKIPKFELTSTINLKDSLERVRLY